MERYIKVRLFFFNVVKKKYKSGRILSEDDTTKKYMELLKEIYRNEGLLAVTGYEIKSFIYSLGKRIDNFFDHDGSYYPPDPATGETFLDAGKLYNKSKQRRDNNIAERRRYILRGRKKDKENGLASKVAGIISLVSFAGSIYFLSPNLTGDIIGTSLTNSNGLSLFLFLSGLTAALVYFKKRQR